jgi:hypothetical protein
MKKGEKRLLVVTVCCIGLLLGSIPWRYYMDAEPVLNIPTPKMPTPNAYDSYVKAGKLHAALVVANPGIDGVDRATDTRRPPVGLSAQQLRQRYPTAAKEAWVRKNAPVFKLLRQGFAYEYLTPPDSLQGGNLRTISKFRDLARLLIIESHIKSERGDWAGAAQSTLDIIHMGHKVMRGGTQVVASVGYTLDAIGHQELEKIVPHLDAVAARAAAAKIEKLEARRVPFSDILQQEKWFYLSNLQELMSKPGWRQVGYPFAALKMRPAWFVMSKRGITESYVRYMDALLAETKKPYALRRTIPLPDDPINQIYEPMFNRSSWTHERDQTGNLLLQVMLALRAFKLERGHYPAKLDELVPSYMKRVPSDPFGRGEAVHYRKTGKAYMLYSIGPDGKDDGGKPIDNPGKKTLKARRLIIEESKGDAVVTPDQVTT